MTVTWYSLLQNRLVLYLLFLPFFIPYSFKFIPSLTSLYDAASFWKLGAVLIIFFLYFMRRQLSKSMLLLLGINGILLFSSLLHGLSDQSVYTDLLPALALPMLIELGLGADIRKMMDVLFRILAGLAIINFLFLLRYPDGLPFATLYTQVRNPLHFLGLDNGIVYVLLALLGLNNLLYEEGYAISRISLLYKRYTMRLAPRIVFFNVLALLTMLIVGSATGLMVLLFFLLFVHSHSIMRKAYAIWLLVGTYCLFFLTVVVAGGSSPLLIEITDFLGRDASFTGRSVLWTGALALIKRSPFIGFGNHPDVIEIWGSYFSAHNQLLDIAIRGGLLSLLMFIVVHLGAFAQLHRAGTRTAGILFATIFCFLMGGLMESGVRPMHYLFLALASYPQLVLNRQQKEHIEG